MTLNYPAQSACDYIVQDNVTNEYSVPSVYLAQAIIYSLEFPVSVVGAIMSLIFICRRKTNFLMRVFVYSSAVTTFFLGISWVYSVPAFKPGISMVEFCVNFFYLYVYGTPCLLLPAILLSCSFSFILLQKFCSVTCTCNNCCQCHQPQRNCLLPRSVGVCLEVLFIVVIIMVPMSFALTLYIANSVLFSENFSVLSIDGFTLYGPGSVFLIFLPIPFGLSLISDIILVIWFCIRRNHIARRRRMLKEIGIFLVHLFETILVGLVYTLFYQGPVDRRISGQAAAIAFSIFLTPLSLFPLCVFVYMRYSFGTPPREDRREGNNRYDIQTAGGGLQTAPPSTRVSLPSDTAEHAPNFLSPSTAEPTDVTPLLN